MKSSTFNLQNIRKRTLVVYCFNKTFFVKYSLRNLSVMCHDNRWKRKKNNINCVNDSILMKVLTQVKHWLCQPFFCTLNSRLHKMLSKYSLFKNVILRMKKNERKNRHFLKGRHSDPYVTICMRQYVLSLDMPYFTWYLYILFIIIGK